MGYYTDFKLSIDGAVFTDEMIDQLRTITEYNSFERVGEVTVTLFDSKWYDHKKDVTKLSTMYPDVLFTLDGDGEERGDVWRMYFKNGKSHSAEVVTTYEPFDKSRLI